MNVARHDSRNWAKMPIRSAMACASSTAINLYNDFWGSNSQAHYRFDQNPVFWSWATFNVAQTFLPWNWGNESYYDYGTGGNVYYEGDTVHTGDNHRARGSIC